MSLKEQCLTLNIRVNMPTSTFNLNIDKLLNDISTQISSMVKNHVEEKLKSVSIHIANVYNLNEEQVWETIQSKFSSLQTNVESPVRRQPKKIITENEMCCMSTKAGTPCKYRRMDGETVCKKHKNMGSAPVQNTEPVTFTRTYFPKSQNDEIIDDVEDEYIIDE